VTQWESYDAIEAVIAALKTIQGPPTYHTNLEQRVYNRLILPTDERAAMPYVCVTTVDERPLYETQSGGSIRMTWEIRVFGFVKEQVMDGPNGVAQQNMLRLHDDIIKACMADPTFGGVVDDTLPVGRPRQAGVNPMYGEVGFGLRVSRWVGPELEFGPLSGN